MNAVVRKVTVRDGAVVWQDFRAYHWRNDGCVFDAVEHTPGLWKLTARGYGVLGMGSDAYGNGALYVRSEDLVDVSNTTGEAALPARKDA